MKYSVVSSYFSGQIIASRVKTQPVKRSRGRPKESGVNMHIIVQPKTKRKIESMVDKKVRERASAGKVIDSQFNQP